MDIEERILLALLALFDAVMDFFTFGRWSKAQGEKPFKARLK